MNRRPFIAALGPAPMAGVAVAAAKPAFATGGVVKSKPYLMGENAPEMIVPLGRMTNGRLGIPGNGPAEVKINVTVDANGNATTRKV